MRIRVTPEKTVSSEAPAKRRRRRFERATQSRGVRLTERDRQVLLALAMHRLLSADQLRRLCFGGTAERRVRRRLLALYDQGLIDRMSVVAQPTRRVPPYLYGLTQEGGRAIAGEVGGPVGVPSVDRKGLRHVVHHVTVCEFYVGLTEAVAALNEQANGGGYSVRQWRHEWDLKAVAADGERRAERVPIRDPQGGQERQVKILPDAFCELARPGGPSLYFFVEVDMSTHALRVWRERALAYSAYDRRGLFRRRFGGGVREAFRLLIVTPPDFRGRSRRANIVRTIEQTIGPSDLFWVATLDELGLWPSRVVPKTDADTNRLLTGRLWSQPGSGETHAILEPAPRIVVRAPGPGRTRPSGRDDARRS